jgi:hypothetical protein
MVSEDDSTGKSWRKSTGQKKEIDIEQVGRYLANELSPSERADFVTRVRENADLHDKVLALELFFQLVKDEPRGGQPSR